MTVYTAIIVEPRKHAALEFVLNNFLENLDLNWNIKIYHGTENGLWLEELVQNNFQDARHRISLQNLGISNLPSSQEYSKVLTTRSFIESIPTETFLVFQTDCIINKKHKHLIYKFIDCDYVGAPWPWDHLHVGNGGLSLRKRSTMLLIIDLFGPYNGLYEDQFYSVGCLKLKAKIPSRKEAVEFSIEQVYNPHSFGIHKPWAYIPERIKELVIDCEGLDTLMSLQKVIP